jgi:hypothetical protein
LTGNNGLTFRVAKHSGEQNRCIARHSRNGLTQLCHTEVVPESDFELTRDELTEKGSLRRKVIADHFGAVIEELFRVIKPGGRLSITDIVSAKQLSQSIVNDPKLWAS